jgi:photosystem II stability/assembly factor-like uncharacterized protein
MKLPIVALILGIGLFINVGCKESSSEPNPTPRSVPTWSQGSFGTDALILGIAFPTPQVGYACGALGVILKSIDSGKTWTQLYSPTLDQLNTVSFMDNDTGIVGGDQGVLLRTTDGGETWAQLNPQFRTLGPNVEGVLDVKYLDKTHVVIAGGAWTPSDEQIGFVKISSDAGVYWTTIRDSYSYFTAIGSDVGRNDPGYSWSSFHVVSDRGVIDITTDGGNTWGHLLFPDEHFRDADAASPGTGIALGDSGVYSPTPGAARAWGVRSSGVSSILRTVYMLNASEGWAGGYEGKLLHTTDGGSSWTREDRPGVINDWLTIVPRDAHHLAFVGIDGLHWLSY